MKSTEMDVWKCFTKAHLMNFNSSPVQFAWASVSKIEKHNVLPGGLTEISKTDLANCSVNSTN